MKEVIRKCIFRPYKKGMGPVFTLSIIDENNFFEGKRRLSYRLHIREPGTTSQVLFEGDDFGPSPMHADDSDETVKALMGFLTLRPGDTDKSYFEEYNEDQKNYCDNYAENLALEVLDRLERKAKCTQCKGMFFEKEGIYEDESGAYFCGRACYRSWSAEHE